MGDLSAHFSSWEFVCHHCGLGAPTGELLSRLERLRSAIARPIYIVSGWRCPTHNARVGGAPRSQHLYGRAVDVPTGLCTVREAVDAGFIGVGHRRGWAVHLDVRQGAPVVFLD